MTGPRRPPSCGPSRTGSRRSGPTRLSTEAGPAVPMEAATVVVTGATGFIGSRVARILRTRGDDVVAIVRDPQTSGADDLRELGARVVPGELTSEPELRAVMTGAASVIHIAG